jgi:hypothetical protein
VSGLPPGRIADIPSPYSTSKVSDQPTALTAPISGNSGILGQSSLPRAPTINTDAKEAEMATEGELRGAEIAAAEARTDTKIARLEGKLDLVLSKLDAVSENTIATRREVKDSERAVKANAWVIGIGMLAVIIALLFGLPSIFDLGMKQRDTIVKEVQEQLQKQEQPPKHE